LKGDTKVKIIRRRQKRDGNYNQEKHIPTTIPTEKYKQ